MTAPLYANTSGLEAKGVVWHNLNGQECIGWTLPKEYFRKEPQAPKPLVTAASAQARIAELEAERDAWKRRGDQHWETLRSIREFAREGDCERIILWVNDAGSGHVESVEQTLGQMTDRATAAEARADRLARAINDIENVADSFCDDSADLLAGQIRIRTRAALQQETQK